jgi:mannose-6-phosphate isomerase-like protein (cupin superfamily)
MSFKVRWWFTLIPAMVLMTSASVFGQEGAARSTGRNVSAMRLTTLPGLPTCALGSVQNGDPSKGSSVIFARIPDGCTIPWHWHTPNENVMIVSGVARIEMKESALSLRAGGFALMGSHHTHQFRCLQACQLYIYSDAAFDIHYVNSEGAEIAPADAMKAVRETAATGMK